MPACYLALGGNVGDVPHTFDRALERLQDNSRSRRIRRSSLYCSRPMGADAGAPFLNAVAEFESTHAPHALLAEFQQIERDLGRERTSVWGPRTLDLDLIYVGGDILDTPSLSLPHRQAWYRRFVLCPMVELAPEFPHPIWKQTQRDLLARIDRRPLPIVLDDVETISDAECLELATDFPGVCFRRGAAERGAGELVVQACRRASAEAEPAVILSDFHLPPPAALRAVLEAALGECESVEV